MSDLCERLPADPHQPPQKEAVELPGAVQHAHGGERDGRSHWRIHLYSVQWADGEKRLSLSQSVW